MAFTEFFNQSIPMILQGTKSARKTNAKLLGTIWFVDFAS